jgi:hypothetical protein
MSTYAKLEGEQWRTNLFFYIRYVFRGEGEATELQKGKYKELR